MNPIFIRHQWHSLRILICMWCGTQNQLTNCADRAMPLNLGSVRICRRGYHLMIPTYLAPTSSHWNEDHQDHLPRRASVRKGLRWCGCYRSCNLQLSAGTGTPPQHSPARHRPLIVCVWLGDLSMHLEQSIRCQDSTKSQTRPALTTTSCGQRVSTVPHPK